MLHDISNDSSYSEVVSSPRPLSDATLRGDLRGALGDLGTLLPFLVGFIVVAGVQPTSILLAFGLSLVIVDWRFGMTMPVQPMKGVGAAALAHTVVGTNDMPTVLALAALMTGVFWLIAAWSGLARWLARHVSRDVVHGVVLGLGTALILAGLRRIESDVVLGAASVCWRSCNRVARTTLFQRTPPRTRTRTRTRTRLHGSRLGAKGSRAAGATLHCGPSSRSRRRSNSPGLRTTLNRKRHGELRRCGIAWFVTCALTAYRLALARGGSESCAACVQIESSSCPSLSWL